MNQLVHFDTNALNRALIGYDSLFGNFNQRFANQINNSYPPYNIIKDSEDSYRIEVAVTGFEPDEVSVEIDQDQLIVTGSSKEDTSADAYLHRGLARRDFTRSWTLADHMEVQEGTIKNGVLTVTLNRVVPESLKPRKLKIKAL